MIKQSQISSLKSSLHGDPSITAAERLLQKIEDTPDASCVCIFAHVTIGKEMVTVAGATVAGARR